MRRRNYTPRIRKRQVRAARGNPHNASTVAYAHRVMRQVKNSGYNPWDIHDCVACGQITSGGSGTVVDCNNCVSGLL